jgi:hypothetical protein
VGQARVPSPQSVQGISGTMQSAFPLQGTTHELIIDVRHLPPMQFVLLQVTEPSGHVSQGAS